MTSTLAPPTGHVAFDSMCEQVEEFDHLPALRSASPEMAEDRDVDLDREAPLDGLILAGLVSP